MQTLHTQLATAFNAHYAHCNYDDAVLASALALYTQLATNAHYNYDDLLNCLNAAYDDDTAVCNTRANTALARDMLHNAVTALDLDSDVASALNLLAQAIVQRDYALQQVYA
jgi:hypothetical protein